MRRIAVIGSNSFSGSDFVDLLLEDQTNDVIGLSRSPEKSALFLPYKNRAQKKFKFLQADFNKDVSKMLEVFDDFKPEYVVNFAAQSEVAPSWENPDHWYQTNVVSLAKFLHELKSRGYLKRYVHISSPEVYGSCSGVVTEDSPVNPSTPYAASKAAADMHIFTLVKNYKFPMVMIRATNVYGAHQQLFKIIPRSVIRIKAGQSIELHGGGEAVKSYIHIRDISRGELAAMLKGEDGLIYHLSPNSGVKVRDVVSTICKKMAVSFESNTRTVPERLGQDAAYVIDSTRARTKLGWFPEISIDDGISGVVNWISSNWEEVKAEPLDYIHKP